MKKLLLISLILLLGINAWAFDYGDDVFVALQATADYTPATVYFRFGSSSGSGSGIKVGIYNGSHELMCTSSPISVSLGNTGSASISGCGALTPTTATYYIGFVGNGYVSPALDTSPTWQVYHDSSGSYATLPATISGSNVAWGEIGVWVTNASGTLLIGDNNLTDNTDVTNSGADNGVFAYYGAGYTCAAQ